MAYKKLKLWFDEELANLLADKIQPIAPRFDRSRFVSAVGSKITDLELKDRVAVMADSLYEGLGGNYAYATDTLVQILGPENELETGMFKEYYWVMPIAKVVETYGLSDFERSMDAIEEITKRNTGEYTIRPYLVHEPERTLARMTRWSLDPNKHVRRLASEGVRPRLPWASKLDQFVEDPTPILPILNNLKDDPSKYVQKSVANCLNDILKDNYEIGKACIDQWCSEIPSKARSWIIKHALRNRIKAGDKWALTVVG